MRCASGLGIIITMMSGSAVARAEFACPAVAADRRTNVARDLFNESLQLEPSDPQAALARLSCAATLDDKPSIALRIGIIDERLQDYRGAIRGFEHYLVLAGKDAGDRDAMQKRIGDLKAQLNAQLSGRSADERAARGRRIAGWVLAGLGGMSAIAGGILLGTAKAGSDSAHAAAATGALYDSPDVHGALDRAVMEQKAGIGLWVVSGALAATGLGLALAPRHDRARGLSLVVGPGTLGACIRFE